MAESSARLLQLKKKGVVVHGPETVHVDDSVNLRNIAPGCIIHPGCRIRGAATSIGPACVIGEEAPVTIDDCQLAENVVLKGGYFAGATFLQNSSFGSCGHVRPGTLMEEQSSAAHAVGLKQTILMPFVTIGSIVNLCDCLIAGGTDRRNYSEVGSSFVHFNFTPHRDKATASLVGDVPRGVMLSERPVFLGGHGGLVGPVRIEFGNVVAAGSIWRKDFSGQGRLLSSQPPASTDEILYDPAQYRKIDRLILNNLAYIGNILALREWYRFVRAMFMEADQWQKACHAGAMQKLDEVLAERFKRMTELAENVRQSANTAGRSKIKMEKAWIVRQKKFAHDWPLMLERIKATTHSRIAEKDRDALLNGIRDEDKRYGYLETIRRLDRRPRTAGTRWLHAVVDSATGLWSI